MKSIHLAGIIAAFGLALGGAQAAGPAQPGTAGPAAAPLAHEAQYRDWGDRRWRGPPGYGPRRACRIERTRIINERTGRVRIVEREVCRPRGPRF